MANRIKKDGTSAMETLRKYLVRDRPGVAMLDKIILYAKDLRQQVSALKSENETLAGKAESLIRENSFDTTERNAAKQRLEKAGADLMQVKHELAKERTKVVELDEALSKDSPVYQCGHPDNKAIEMDVVEIVRLGKRVRKTMKMAPLRTVEQSVPMIELSQSIQFYDDYEYRKIGMFTVLSCFLNFPVGYWCGDPLHANVLPLEQRRKFVVWTTTWFGEKAFNDMLFRATDTLAEVHPSSVP